MENLIKKLSQIIKSASLGSQQQNLFKKEESHFEACRKGRKGLYEY
jgi:hypothetical protein